MFKMLYLLENFYICRIFIFFTICYNLLQFVKFL